MQTRTLAGLLATGLALTAIAPAARAAIITVSDPGERRIVDSDGDGDSDEVTSSGTLQLGGGASDVSNFRAFWKFNLSDLAGDIATAGQITFSVTLTGGTNISNLGAVELVALSGTESSSWSGSNFDAPGTVVKTFDTTGLSGGSVLTADVTAAVKADAEAGWTTFRMQAADPSVYFETDGVADILTFGSIGNSDATLSIDPIPEPASLALMGLGGLLCLTRRREA